ncbi:unnamed protein product, partial [Mesorhabditis spiculigera]
MMKTDEDVAPEEPISGTNSKTLIEGVVDDIPARDRIRRRSRANRKVTQFVKKESGEEAARLEARKEKTDKSNQEFQDAIDAEVCTTDPAPTAPTTRSKMRLRLAVNKGGGTRRKVDSKDDLRDTDGPTASSTPPGTPTKILQNLKLSSMRRVTQLRSSIGFQGNNKGPKKT